MPCVRIDFMYLKKRVIIIIIFYVLIPLFVKPNPSPSGYAILYLLNSIAWCKIMTWPAVWADILPHAAAAFSLICIVHNSYCHSSANSFNQFISKSRIRLLGMYTHISLPCLIHPRQIHCTILANAYLSGSTWTPFNSKYCCMFGFRKMFTQYAMTDLSW